MTNIEKEPTGRGKKKKKRKRTKSWAEIGWYMIKRQNSGF